jgi:hypothetical protein
MKKNNHEKPPFTFLRTERQRWKYDCGVMGEFRWMGNHRMRR